MTEDANSPTEDQDVTGGEENVTADDDNDSVAEAIRAGLEAERERIVQEERERLRAEFEERNEAERRARDAETQAQSLLASFGSTIREVRQNLKGVKFYDENGDERSLSDDELERLVVQPLVHYNQTGEKAASLKVLAALSSTALNSLPETVKDEFIKRATGKPLQEWLDHYAELRAGETQWAKRTKAEHEAAVKAAEARGEARAKKAPPTSPRLGEGKESSGSQDLSTISGLVKAKAAGLISDEDFQKRWKIIRG